MKNIKIVLLFNLYTCVWGFSQSSLELSISFNNSMNIRSNIAGSSVQFDDYSQISSYNLKAKLNNAMFFSLSNTIGKSNWNYFGGFEKRWLGYFTTIYSQTSSFEDIAVFEELVIKNQMNNFTFGGGRRFFFFKKKLILNLQAGLVYRNYRDVLVETRRNVNSFYEIENGDVSYEILMDYNKYNSKLKPFISLSVGWQLLEKIRVDLNFVKSDYFAMIYELTKSNYKVTEIETPEGIQRIVSGSGSRKNFEVRSRFESFGIGVTYSIDKSK